MTFTLWLLTLAAMAVTFANGANDNFKGVATLHGSGTTPYRRALAWATVTTAAGSLAALVLAGSLVAQFSGRGLVPDVLSSDPTFLFAVGGGAAFTVLLASWFGFPISTTHALTGGLVGAGFLAAGDQLRIATLGSQFLAPLLFSPFVAAVLVGAIYPAATAVRRRWAANAETCLCVADVHPAVATGGHAASVSARAPSMPMPVVGSIAECAAHGLTAAVTERRALDVAHYISAGLVGFARGVNDTPKLVALLLPVSPLASSTGLLVITAVMAAGGLLGARRVAETMSHRVTAMNHGQGFGANIVTAGLVLIASRVGLPVSTTHVSNGSLFGLGAITGGARWKVITQIVLAWIVTLPCAALFSAVLWRLSH